MSDNIRNLLKHRNIELWGFKRASVPRCQPQRTLFPHGSADTNHRDAPVSTTIGDTHLLFRTARHVLGPRSVSADGATHELAVGADVAEGLEQDCDTQALVVEALSKYSYVHDDVQSPVP